MGGPLCGTSQSSAFSKGMRLEPWAGLRDVAQLDSACVPAEGLRVLFWNQAAEGMTHHRNPLFSEATHLGPQSLCADELHTMFLGVFQDYILGVFWAVLSEDCYDVGAGMPAEALTELGVERLRKDLFAWYKRAKAENPEMPVYELQYLEPSSLGTKAKPALTATRPLSRGRCCATPWLLHGASREGLRAGTPWSLAGRRWSNTWTSRAVVETA